MVLFESAVSFVKNESNLPLPFLRSSEDGRPMRIQASPLDSWFGFSLLKAFCVASRAVGEGGRGAGFTAWATSNVIVAIILTDDMTGSEQNNSQCNSNKMAGRHTDVIPVDGRIHDNFHLIPNHLLLVRAEVVRPVRIVVYPEVVLFRTNGLVHADFVPDDVDLSFSFDLRLLQIPKSASVDRQGSHCNLQHDCQSASKISRFPAIVYLSLLAHPVAILRLPNLLKDA